LAIVAKHGTSFTLRRSVTALEFATLTPCLTGMSNAGYGDQIAILDSLTASFRHYHDEWPIRKWTPRGEAKVVRSRKHNVFVVYHPFRWAVSADSEHADGGATLYLRIRKNSLDEFRIVHIQQLGR